MVIHAWCADAVGTIHQDRLEALLTAYIQVRPLSKDEMEALPMMLKAAAIRFLCTRANDWYNTPNGAEVVKKDPKEYALKFVNCQDWI